MSIDDEIPPEAQVRVDRLRAARVRNHPPSERIPPGQRETKDWPVLHHGQVPRIDRTKWTLRVWGLVQNPFELSWNEFAALPQTRRTNDIHCVTHWSRLDNQWDGVPVGEILRLARPKPQAHFVVQHAAGGWTTNLPMEDFDRDENLLATHHGGEPIPIDHGWPCRVVIPHLYFWKGAKWVTGIELIEQDRPGFWEKAGYHMHGDPWKQERFRGD